MQNKKWKDSTHGKKSSKTVKRGYIADLYANAFEDLDEIDGFLRKFGLLI